MAVSEVARIRENIANEYMAATWGLTGLAYGIPRHTFITARMENMEHGRQQLTALVGDQNAIELVAEILMNLPDEPERHTILDVITHIRGNTEATAHLIDYIRDMWETMDLLKKEFGEEDAQKIIAAPGSNLLTVPEL